MFELKNQRCGTRGLHLTHDDADAVGCALVTEILATVDKTTWEHRFCSVMKNSEKNIDDVFSSLIDTWEADIRTMPDILLVTDISIKKDTENRFLDFLNRRFFKKSKNYYWNNTKSLGIVWIDHHKTNNMRSEFLLLDKSEKISASGILFSELSVQTLENIGDLPGDEYIAKITSSFTEMIESFKHDGLAFMYIISEMFAEESIESRCNLINLARIIYDVSRYDTYLFKKEPSKVGHEYDVNAITRYFGSENTLMLLLEFLNDLKIETICLTDYEKTIPYPNSLIRVINEFERKEFEMKQYALENYKIIDNFDDIGHTVAVLVLDDEHNTHHNEQAEAIYMKEKDIHYVLLIQNNLSISLRTNRKDIDLGAICKELWDGGGHPQAAGATLSKEQKDVMLQKYNDSK